MLAETLHDRLSSMLANSGHSVTCSMGALILPPSDHCACEELMQLADQLMYAVKGEGKNAVNIATAQLDIGPGGLCSWPKTSTIVAQERVHATA